MKKILNIAIIFGIVLGTGFFSALIVDASILQIAGGGTSVPSFTAYAPIFGGITATGALQSGTVGTSGQVLTSNGAGALPTFQPAGAASSITVGSTSITSGNNGYIEYNNSGILGELATTGSSSVVRATSPTLVTPALGVATATSINGVTISGSSTPALTVTGTTAVSGTNTGDQTITLTGNVTGSGTGSFATTIGAGVVTNAMLAGSISNANLANSTISGISLGSNLANLTATDSTLTFSGSYNGGTARTVGLNLGNGNTFTAEQQIQLTTTQLSVNYDGTHTTTFTTSSAGGLTIADTTGVVTLPTLVFGTVGTSNAATCSSTGIGLTSTAIMQFNGVTNTSCRYTAGGSSSSTLTASSNYANFIVGSSPLTAAASGTHGILANIVIQPIGTVTNATPVTITNTASLYIAGAGSGGTNNYALWDVGQSRLDLGSDATGDIFYRASTGVFTRLAIGAAGTHLVVSSGLPSWTAQTGVSNYTHTIFTPTTGQTITLINNQYNIVNPAGALLALTINLPSTPANNDVVYIKFTQNVTTVTYANGTVVDGITAPTAGGLTVLTYDSGTTSWY